MEEKGISKTPYIITGVVFTVIFGLILWGIGSSLGEDNSAAACCILTPILIYGISIFALGNAYSKANNASIEASKNQTILLHLREQYETIKKTIDIPVTAKEIVFFKSSEKSIINPATNKNPVYIWKAEANICLFPSTPATQFSLSLDNVKVYLIPVSQIEYFSKRGEIFRENKISGGGGGGSSIGGAVAGGLIAGDVGAVIGSRKKVEGIKSELVTHDTRETFINYFDENKERQSLFFDNNAFQVLNDLIPEKEFNIVNSLKSNMIINNQLQNIEKKTITDQLRELAKLKDDGIISEDEFFEKKKILLDKIS
jgi:hypothetical protein